MSVSHEPRGERGHRNRTILLVVAVVVLAVAIPFAVIQLLANGGTPSTNGPSSTTVTSTTGTTTTTAPTTTTQTPTPTTTSTGPVVVGEVVLDPANAPADVAPLVTYALGQEIITPEGTVPLPLKKTDQLWAFVPHADGWVVVGYRPKIDEAVARVVEGSGYVSSEWLAGWATPAAGWDGSSAYAVLDAVQVDGPDGVVIQGWPLPIRGEYRPVGILPDGGVIVNDVKRQRVETGAPGTPLKVVPGIIAVNGVSATGQVTTLDKLKTAGSCGSLRESLDSEPTWSTCTYTLGKFNPSGTLVVGYPDYRDGIGDWRVSLLDAATGTTYVDFETRSTAKAYTFISSAVWEDDTHLLALVYNSDIGWKVLRLGVGGSVTAADVAVPIPSPGELVPPIIFVTQP